MRSGLLAFLAVVVACTPHPSRGAPGIASPRAFSALRHPSPEAAVRGYFAGSDRCASDLLRAAFHPAAHMVWIDGDAVRTRAMLAWWQRPTRRRRASPPPSVS